MTVPQNLPVIADFGELMLMKAVFANNENMTVSLSSISGRISEPQLTIFARYRQMPLSSTSPEHSVADSEREEYLSAVDCSKSRSAPIGVSDITDSSVCALNAIVSIESIKTFEMSTGLDDICFNDFIESPGMVRGIVLCSYSTRIFCNINIMSSWTYL